MPYRLHALTLGDVLREHRRSQPNGLAVVCGEQRCTYPELDERVNRLACALTDAGVGAGERVAWLGQNCHRVLETLLAAAKLGAVLCPVNWRLSSEELSFVLDDLDPAFVIWQSKEIGDRVAAARETSTTRAPWFQHDADGDATYEALVAGSRSLDPDVDVDPTAAVLILYTAAFAGRPNGALLSHLAVVWQSMIWSSTHDITSAYVYLNSAPLFHVAALMSTLATFLAGGTNVFTPRVHAEELCRLIETEHCTGAFIVEPTVSEIVACNRDGRYDLSSLRAPAGRPEWNAMITVGESRWDRHPGGYGQTETMGMLTYRALGGDALGISGRPVPGTQVRVVDDEGHELPAGEVGEVVARGPTIMNGYHRRPELDAQRQRGGWHHTNDLARRERDGSLTFVGPKARLIKSASENIYPAEVEVCIAAHPAVAECAVIGVPDSVWTQSVKALVVLRTGARATRHDIIEHCRSRIASYKKPRTVEFVDALPRRSGRVDYEELDARHGGGGYPGTG